MTKPHFTQGQLVQVAKLSDADLRIIKACRGKHNKLGFAYQLCYVKLFNPSDDTIQRLIQTQREKARTNIYEKIASELTPELRQKLDDLLIVGTETYSKLYQIKKVPQKPSAKAMKLLSDKLTLIEKTE